MLEKAAGIALVALALADVFVTVLYARMYSGLVAHRVAKMTAAVFRVVTARFGKRRGKAMSLLGPVIVVQIVSLWITLLTVGMALLIHPALGKDVVAASGETSTDFVTALYAGGSSVSIVAAGDFSPRSDAYRLVYLMASIIGFTSLSLVITYLMQIYNSLHRRNTLGLKIEMLCAGKGDAAELVARLGPRGMFDTSTSTVTELAAEMSAIKEAHHFYPVLVYFRFAEPFYAVSRFTHVSCDAFALIDAALDKDAHGWVAESGSVLHLWESSKHMLEALTRTFSPNDPPEDWRPTADDVARWRARFARALPRLRAAGITLVADEEAAFQRYADLRARWDGLACALAETLGFSADDVDPAGSQAAAPVIQRRAWGPRGGSSSPSYSSS